MTAIVNPVASQYSAPTTFDDGSPIPSGTIVRFEYGFGTTSGNYTQIVPDTDLTVNAAGKQTGPLPANLALGNWFAAARSVTKDGAVSKWSNEVALTVQAKTPNPIVDFSLA